MDKLLKLKDRIVAKVFNFLTLNFIFPLVYKRAAKKDVDPNKVVFVELRLPALSNSFKVIFDELVSKYDFTVHAHFLRNSAFRRNVYMRRAIDMLKDIATAKYVFMNEGSNCIGSIDARKETKIIQLWHGCGAFKKFGLSTADLIFGANRKEQLKHPFNKNYSLVTISSPEVAWAYEEAMNLSEHKEVIQATGSSRTDVFYDEKFIENAYETLYDIVPQAKGKKIILYAPTFRGRVARAKTSRMFNIEMFYEKFKDDYIVLFKHHPLVKKLPAIPTEYADFAIDVTRTMEIEDLLCVSDICITDYSSLVFEYSLFEKPIIFFAYDLDTYFDWRGFYYDYYEMSPGPVCTTNLEMIEYIENIDKLFDIQKVKDFRYKFMRSCDGNSTKRILENVIGEQELKNHSNGETEVLPYNIVPKSVNMYRDYIEKLDNLEKDKKAFSAVYEKLRDKKVQPKKIALLDCSHELSKAIRRYVKENIVSLKTKNKTHKEKIEIVKQLSEAEYIFVEKNNDFLDLLNIKDDTTVVYVPEYGFNFLKFEKATLDYKSGYYYNKESIAPTNRRVDKVATPVELYKDVYCESIGIGEESLTYVGDVKTDRFYSKKFKEKALNKLVENTGVELGDKKILLDFVQRAENVVPKYESSCDNYLYEYLNKDYVILKYFEIDEMPNGEEIRLTPSMNSYTKGIINITDILSPYEAVAVADVVIGSITNNFFLSFAAMKPAYAFVPDLRARLHNRQVNFKYDAVLPSPAFTDAKALAIAIKNVSDYDFTKMNKFSNTFFNNPDGKSAKRLLQRLGIIE